MYSLDYSWELANFIKAKCALLKTARNKTFYKRFYSDRLDSAAVSDLIASQLDCGVPFMVGRWGSVESRLVGEWLWNKQTFSRKTYLESHRNAGIFPANPDVFVRVANRLLDSSRSLDLVGCWESPYQARLITESCSNTALCDLSSLEPWLLNRESWLSRLQDKKVLIVHPLVTTILTQLDHLDKIFARNQGLPKCDVKLLKPPVTLGFQTQGFSSWLDALQDLEARVSSCSFDVALIGCGAYGMPLAAAIKAMGKPAIHLGGPLQLLFGIRGRRWEAMPQYAALVNDFWVRPSPDETPVAADQVDGGSYW